MNADEHSVVQRLMTHLCDHAQVGLAESADDQATKAGTWRWLGRSDPAAASGRARLFLATAQEVQMVKSTLDGRTIKIGMDSFLVRVHNDLTSSQTRGRGPE